MFDIKQFNSGEYEVTLTERIRTDIVDVHWDYFTQKDIMVPILQAAAIRQTYGNTKLINLVAPYLPYARQDRQFEAGQCIHFQVFIKQLESHFDSIETMGLHCGLGKKNIHFANDYIWNYRHNLMAFPEDYMYVPVLPDESAWKHYYSPAQPAYIFSKVRDQATGEPTLKLIDDVKLFTAEELEQCKFIICDDVGDGNRTFAECANALHKMYEGYSIKIELLLYHSFCTYGLQNLFDAGISKMKIINPASYKYLTTKYPQFYDFFELVTFKGNANV